MFHHYSPHNAGYQSDWLSAWSVCCTMGHEGGGRGHFSLTDVVIISLLRIAPAQWYLLCWPNIQMIAALISSVMQTVFTTSCQAAARALVQGRSSWHGTSQGSSQKTDILFLTRHTATIRTQDDENKILWVVLLTGWRDSCQALTRAAWNSLRPRLKLNNCLIPLFWNEFFSFYKLPGINIQSPSAPPQIA